ncbi:MAG: ABC transporter permease [Parachlamydiaceae bacterium]|nr:ABC transporter permease [Parachlamydiaceae bacterium]
MRQDPNPPFNLVIDPTRAQQQYLHDLYSFRELFYFLAWRDIIVKYKQAFFGASWALLRPLLNMAVFAFLFGKVANLPSEGVNYALFVFAALIPWQLYSGSAVDTCNCLVNNGTLITKVYFPRMIIPLAQIIVHLVDFTITAIPLLVITIFLGYASWNLLAFPAFLALTTAFCIGTGLWLSALTVQYRDFRIIVPFFVQFGMFISPVGYGTFLIPEKWLWLYCLNPLVGIIDGFRWSLFGIGHDFLWYSILSSVTVSCTLLISGFFYFRNVERTFADKI